MTIGNNVVKEHSLYKKLQDQCEEYLGNIQFYASQCDEKDKELRFLHDFLMYKEISDEYDLFRKNAHEADGSDILPYYTL